jgi:hypothetical protein
MKHAKEHKNHAVSASPLTEVRELSDDDLKAITGGRQPHLLKTYSITTQKPSGTFTQFYSYSVDSGKTHLNGTTPSKLYPNGNNPNYDPTGKHNTSYMPGSDDWNVGGLHS